MSASSLRNTAISGSEIIASPYDLKTGLVIAERYTIVRFLGRGAFGTVYECTDSVLADLPVAVKIYPRPSSKNKKNTPRIHREMLTCQKVNHPNVAAFYDCIQTEHLVGYSMELVDGSSFDELIRQGRFLKTNELIRFFKQLVRGLAAIHSSGVIHRDIKPSNILLTDLLEVKISDFGIANQCTVHDVPGVEECGDIKELSELKNMACSLAGSLVGTPLYLAPEYIKDGVFDHRSDLYACGAMWYEILTGRPPHNQSELPELLICKVKQIPPSAFEVNPGCCETLSEIVMKLIARNPEDRFQSAEEVERELLRFEQKMEKAKRKGSDGASRQRLKGDLFASLERSNPLPTEIKIDEIQDETPDGSQVRKPSPVISQPEIYLAPRKGDKSSILENLWDIIGDHVVALPIIVVAIAILSLVMLAFNPGNKSQNSPSASLSSSTLPEPKPIVSNSQVLRSVEDAKRVRTGQ